VFGDIRPDSIELEDMEQLRRIALTKVSLHEAHRLVKIWRAFWKVMAAMKLCELGADPWLAVRNTAPHGRSATWKAGEMARLAKEAWRRGYCGLTALIACAWDTQFSPVDLRAVTPSQRRRDARGDFFIGSRAKTQPRNVGDAYEALCTNPRRLPG
jgi:hypothetical protein